MIYKSKKKFTRKITVQLFLLFLLVCIIPFAFIQYMAHYMVEKSLEEQINDFMEDSVKKSSDSVSSYLEDKRFFLGLLSTDDEFIKLASDLNDSTGMELDFKDKAKAINNSLMTASFYKNDINQVIFVTRDMIKVSKPGSEDGISRETYKSIVDLTRDNMRVVGGIVPTGSGEENYRIYLARSVVELNSLKYLGTLIICLDPSYLGKLIENNNAYNYYSTYIKTPDGKILTFAKDSAEYIFDADSFYDDKNNLNTYEKTLEIFDWKLVNVINEDKIYKGLNYSKDITILVSVLIVLVMILAIFMIGKFLTKPIYTLASAMNKVRGGDFGVRIEEKSKNEFINIEENFNYMIRYIDDLILENALQSKNLLLAYKKKKEAEIIALEAQINPHFLYNTLDSINWMAIENGEEEISRMLKSLGLLLRYSLKDNNKKVLIKEDVKWLEEYLYLQKQRFLGLFDYEIKVEDGLEEVKIYKLIIQPLVENCILHAFVDRESGGNIKIEYSSTYDVSLLIKVSDNGVGLSVEELNKIRKCIEDKKYNDLSKSLGMYNVIFRLFSYYGDDFDLSINSDEDGTKFLIEIPL